MISTISVYSDTKNGNITENSSTFSQLSQYKEGSQEYYGAGKIDAESMAQKIFPNRNIQFIDCRDLVEWILYGIKHDINGIYNAVGFGNNLTMQNFLVKIKQVTDSNAEFIWVTDEYLLGAKIIPWSEMPLWLPESENGFLAINADKALTNGLQSRNLELTIKDTWVWDQKDKQADSDLWLDKQKEMSLLAI